MSPAENLCGAAVASHSCALRGLLGFYNSITKVAE